MSEKFVHNIFLRPTTSHVLPAYKRQGYGGYLLRRFIEDAKSAQVGLRLTVLEVNPARRSMGDMASF
jgi:ribosomal protein S18 acetylase RimI-like enzyme